MLVLYTDFGWQGPYVGQLKAVLARQAPGVPVIDLMHDAPTFAPRAASYLLAALVEEFSEGTVFVCVVDPGVGGARRPLIARMGGRWFVGPDNGLLQVPASRAGQADWWSIDLAPARLSATFHGRDLFAPAAARIARGEPPPGSPCDAPDVDPRDWPEDLPELIYIDAFGNATTGLRGSAVSPAAALQCGDQLFQRVRTFSDAPPGTPICYENSSGLMELAASQDSVRDLCNLAVGDAVGCVV